jgi:hypothetical protein
VAQQSKYADEPPSAINSLASASELVHHLHLSEPAAVFGDASILPQFQEAQKLDTTGRLSKLTFVSLDQKPAGASDACIVSEHHC